MIGYKAFSKGLKNRYGQQFEIGKEYMMDGSLSFGNEGNGYHFCKHLSDVFRYFDSTAVEVAVISTTSDEVKEYNDEYEGYYDMYVCRSFKIEKVLTREEIMEIMLKEPEYNIEKFVKTFKLTDEEANLFAAKSLSLNKCIDYYHYGNKDAYKIGGIR